jgi:uncharacterized membrane protein SirB2
MRGKRDPFEDSANPPDHRALLRVTTENFSGVYLTMLSIIQGVALTDLASIFFSERTHMTIVQWVQVATMLWTLVYVWNHFMADALVSYWIPDLEDAALLFGTGVFEIVANHAIEWGAAPWLTTLAIMLCCWSVGTFYIRRQEEHVVRDPVLLRMLRRRMNSLGVQTFVGGVVMGVAATVCAATHAGAGGGAAEGRTIALVSVIVAFGVSVGIGGSSTGFWRRVRRYAYTGEMP